MCWVFLPLPAYFPHIYYICCSLSTYHMHTIPYHTIPSRLVPYIGVGATAGDEECWSLFQDLFYPIIQAWHNYNPLIQTQPIDLDPHKLRYDECVCLHPYIHTYRHLHA
ncbi:hypothetical protein EON63_08220 [archaeon]|nr:MAG: hypothetical protein EON63_08220 [archaeon]